METEPQAASAAFTGSIAGLWMKIRTECAIISAPAAIIPAGERAMDAAVTATDADFGVAAADNR